MNRGGQRITQLPLQNFASPQESTPAQFKIRNLLEGLILNESEMPNWSEFDEDTVVERISHEFFKQLRPKIENIMVALLAMIYQYPKAEVVLANMLWSYQVKKLTSAQSEQQVLMQSFSKIINRANSNCLSKFTYADFNELICDYLAAHILIQPASSKQYSSTQAHFQAFTGSPYATNENILAAKAKVQLYTRLIHDICTAYGFVPGQFGITTPRIYFATCPELAQPINEPLGGEQIFYNQTVGVILNFTNHSYEIPVSFARVLKVNRPNNALADKWESRIVVTPKFNFPDKVGPAILSALKYLVLLAVTGLFTNKRTITPHFQRYFSNGYEDVSRLPYIFIGLRNSDGDLDKFIDLSDINIPHARAELERMITSINSNPAHNNFQGLAALLPSLRISQAGDFDDVTFTISTEQFTEI